MCTSRPMVDAIVDMLTNTKVVNTNPLFLLTKPLILLTSDFAPSDTVLVCQQPRPHPPHFDVGRHTNSQNKRGTFPIALVRSLCGAPIGVCVVSF